MVEMLREAGPKVCPMLLRRIFSTFTDACRACTSTTWRISTAWTHRSWVSYLCLPLGSSMCRLTLHAARFLRLLASNFIFREVSPDVFANNRISSMIDTGKSSKEILAEQVLVLYPSGRVSHLAAPKTSTTVPAASPQFALSCKPLYPSLRLC